MIIIGIGIGIGIGIEFRIGLVLEKSPKLLQIRPITRTVKMCSGSCLFLGKKYSGPPEWVGEE
jgi:hypothetical protein